MRTLELQTLGDKLRQRRKELNLTIKEVETATSIRLTYLQAIEENQVMQLIPSVYAQGFVKQYASYLGMDPEQVLRDHPEISKRNGKQEFNYGIGTLEMRNSSPHGGTKWMPNALWMGVFGFVLLAAWYFARLLEVI